jgi:hypothetical protein
MKGSAGRADGRVMPFFDAFGNSRHEPGRHVLMTADRLVRFQAKACPGLDPGWKPVRVKKTHQIKNLEPRFDSIETEKALVQATERVLGHNPLEILFVALDAISKAPVGLHRQQRENCIDVALFDDIAALRSVNLAKDVVVDMICVFHGVPRL